MGGKKYKDFEWDKSIPSKEYFDEMFRVGKNLIIWGRKLYDSVFTTFTRMVNMG